MRAAAASRARWGAGSTPAWVHLMDRRCDGWNIASPYRLSRTASQRPSGKASSPACNRRRGKVSKVLLVIFRVAPGHRLTDGATWTWTSPVRLPCRRAITPASCSREPVSQGADSETHRRGAPHKGTRPLTGDAQTGAGDRPEACRTVLPFRIVRQASGTGRYRSLLAFRPPRPRPRERAIPVPPA